MIIGIPKEIKQNETRVALTPSGVREFVAAGHEVLVEYLAGEKSHFTDDAYQDAGATLVEKAELFAKAALIYKVKEILPPEYELLREGQIIFTYIHSNAHVNETEALLKQKVIGIAYEDITDDTGGFPLLRPMSKIAGRGGFLAACKFSQSKYGSGLLLAKLPGMPTPHITILGVGSAGLGAGELAAAWGNQVTMIARNIAHLEKASAILPPNVEFLYSEDATIETCIEKTDVLINCVMWSTERIDHLVTREMLKKMKPNAMIVDVSTDENGAIETCHSTTHDDPIYYEEGILHYCVDNIPAAYAKTASYLLSKATLPYALTLAEKGYQKTLIEDPHFRHGLCFYKGELTLKETALKQKRKYTTPEEVLGIKE